MNINKLGNRLREFDELIHDEELINSKYYEEVLCKALKIEDDELLEEFVSLATSPSLLQSQYYNFALDLAMTIDSTEVINEFIYIACDENLLNSKYYEYVLSESVKEKYKDVLHEFYVISTDENMLEQEDYIDKLNQVFSFERVKIITFYIFICNVCDKEKYPDITKFMTTIANMNDMLLENWIGCLKGICWDNLHKKDLILLIDSLIDISKMDNVYVAKDIFTDVLHEVMTHDVRNISTDLEQVIEKEKEDMNILSIIPKCESTDEMLECLSYIEDDEDITPNTLVKKLFP